MTGTPDSKARSLHEALAPTASARELFDLGNTFNDRGRYDLGHECFARAQRAEPGNAEFRRALGLSLCRRGQLHEGLAHYEARWKLEQMRSQLRPYRHAFWRGEPLQGKRLLLWAEQGIGDEILFARCIAHLCGSGAQVTVECDARLHALLRRSFPGIECFPKKAEGLPELRDGEFDYQSSMLSAWRWMPESLLTGAAYLRPNPVLVQGYRDEWRRRGWARNVGLSWRGGSARTGEKRSLKPAWLAPVFKGADLTLHTVQYGLSDADRADASARLGHVIMRDSSCDEKDDLDRLAALMGALDLVITIDNATAHVAGAIGTPVWLLVPTGSVWYWGSVEERPAIYPGARVFRQSEPGKWDTVIAQLTFAFGAEFGSTPAPQA